MSDWSFVRFGGLAGILLAITSWLAVLLYFAGVPAAQQLPIADTNGYLASLAENPTATLWFNGLQALIAVGSLVGTAAVYYRVRSAGEAWAFFGTVVGMIAAALWTLFALQEAARLQYVASTYADDMGTALTAFNAPSPVNPFRLVTTALPAIWFLVIGLLMLRAAWPRSLVSLGLIAAADLAVGFVVSVAGDQTLPIITALVAGAVGGPLFWLWVGVLLWREPQG